MYIRLLITSFANAGPVTFMRHSGLASFALLPIDLLPNAEYPTLQIF
jgi:hypothetical protein